MLAATWTLRPDGHTLNSYHEYHKIDPRWDRDIDSLGFFAIEVETMVKDLGYVNKGLQFYYKIPNSNLDIGLKPLSSDKDVMEMCKYVSKCK
ncbi:hypothetical protein Tco_1473089, partial [Tanacetum coccineum]